MSCCNGNPWQAPHSRHKRKGDRRATAWRANHGPAPSQVRFSRPVSALGHRHIPSCGQICLEILKAVSQDESRPGGSGSAQAIDVAKRAMEEKRFNIEDRAVRTAFSRRI